MGDSLSMRAFPAAAGLPGSLLSEHVEYGYPMLCC